MGKLEEINKKNIRRTKLQEAVLATLASGGYKSSALIPEILNSALNLDIQTSLRRKDITRTAVSRLVRRGMVEFKNDRYSLTKTGEKILNEWHTSKYKIKQPKKWDGKWRMIIFDIPEKKRSVRRQINIIFNEAGFRRLQDSVWVYPYDCEDVIGLIKTDFGIGKDLLYVIADQIENDKYLRMDFDLL